MIAYTLTATNCENGISNVPSSMVALSPPSTSRISRMGGCCCGSIRTRSAGSSARSSSWCWIQPAAAVYYHKIIISNPILFKILKVNMP